MRAKSLSAVKVKRTLSLFVLAVLLLLVGAPAVAAAGGSEASNANERVSGAVDKFAAWVRGLSSQISDSVKRISSTTFFIPEASDEDDIALAASTDREAGMFDDDVDKERILRSVSVESSNESEASVGSPGEDMVEEVVADDEDESDTEDKDYLDLMEDLISFIRESEDEAPLIDFEAQKYVATLEFAFDDLLVYLSSFDESDESVESEENGEASVLDQLLLSAASDSDAAGSDLSAITMGQVKKLLSSKTGSDVFVRMTKRRAGAHVLSAFRMLPRLQFGKYLEKPRYGL